MNRILLILTLALTGAAFAADAKPADPAEVKTVPYALKTCIVSGEELGSMGDAVVLIHNGQEVKFCCAGCIKKFKKDPDKFLKAMNEQVQAGAGEKAAADPAKAGDGNKH